MVVLTDPQSLSWNNIYDRGVGAFRFFSALHFLSISLTCADGCIETLK